MKKVFLGGTCADSVWRDELVKMLNIDYFNPVVDDWNEESQKQELYERENCDFCLYTITPEMLGFYSIAEVADDSNKRPEKTVFCWLDYNNLEFNKKQRKSLQAVAGLVERNGGKSFNSLEDVADYLNGNL